MKKAAAVVLLALGIATQASAQSGAFLARFSGGFGVDPVARPTGQGTTINGVEVFSDVEKNNVRSIPSSFFSWRIADLTADIYTDGRVKATGRGLVLASTDLIGHNNNEKVSASLTCLISGVGFVEYFTDRVGVPLELNGDFSIDDVLNETPSECVEPVLLIRGRSGRWLAAGVIRKSSN